ncbi:hypothetical protein Syun_018484 [Stephania yunnanensis]|uniref:Uncharacterized protein n=1 Tax=Stephania yunnanensis TaxID=152371 RepID=A0AAP0ISB4_9MAGN
MHFSPKIQLHNSPLQPLRLSSQAPKARKIPNYHETPSDPPSPNRVPLSCADPSPSPMRENIKQQLTLLALRTHLQSRILATRTSPKLPQVPRCTTLSTNSTSSSRALESLIGKSRVFGREELRGEIDELFGVLKRVFVDCGGKSLVEGNVDACGVNNGSLDDAMENEFKKGLEKIKSRREHRVTMERLNFLLGIGFGQNLVTIKVLSACMALGLKLQSGSTYFLI